MKRIQKKWGKPVPSGSIYVGRPSPWGNPYKLGEYSREQALDLYRAWIYRKIQEDPHYLDPLRAKDLVCWCKLTEKCHGDILLELLEMGL